MSDPFKDIKIYSPPINFCGPSLDNTDHMIQNRTILISEDIHRSILYPSLDFILTEHQETRKRSSETFNRSWKTKNTFLQKPVTEKLKSLFTVNLTSIKRSPLFSRRNHHLEFPVGLFYIILSLPSGHIVNYNTIFWNDDK